MERREALPEPNFSFNGDGELSYTIRTAEGQEEVKTVEVPQNYRLEVEQFGRCIDENEKPHGYGRIFAEKCETC